MSDLISREDAMGAVQDHFNADGFRGYDDGQKMMDRIKALPSAETNEIRTETHGVCSDLISRADAINQAQDGVVVKTQDTSIHLCKTRVVTVDRINELPSAKAEWIPCSERLPKRDELVFVTYKTTDRIHLCRYLDDGSENPWWSYIDDCCAWNNVVLAWMPLPKPYRKDGEDDGED